MNKVIITCTIKTYICSFEVLGEIYSNPLLSTCRIATMNAMTHYLNENKIVQFKIRGTQFYLN
jgi:hypothetical protein